MPSPEATIWRIVSSEFPCILSVSDRLSSGQASKTCMRKQWPAWGRITFSLPSFLESTDFLFAHEWPTGTTSLNTCFVKRVGGDAWFIKWEGDDDGVQFAVFRHGHEIRREVFFDLQRHGRRPFVKD